MKLLSGGIVVAFALFLLGLAVTIYARPRLAERFLNAFASSAAAHYVEQAVRLAVGGSLVLFSSEMWQPGAFRLLGWIIIVTTIGLLCLPWQWHHRFARWVVPPAIRYMKLYGFGAAVLGSFLLYGVFAAGATGAASRYDAGVEIMAKEAK